MPVKVNHENAPNGGAGARAARCTEDSWRSVIMRSDRDLVTRRDLGSAAVAGPLRGDNVGGPSGGSAQGAREAPAVGVDRLQHLTALSHTHAVLVAHVGRPHRALGIQADPVRVILAQVGPHAPVRQGTARADVEGGQPVPVGLGDDQCCVIGRDHHAVREGEVLGTTATHIRWLGRE